MMTDQEQIEAVYAGMAMIGFIIQEKPLEDIPELSKAMARKMMEESTVIGLPAIKRRKNAR
jgi:hypothetical protein